MHRLAALAALSLCGCLAIPDEPANLCGTRADYAEMAFPPPGMDLSLRQITTVDVNLDQALDLVLANAPADSADWGVFVLLGPQSDPDALQYHAFVPTSTIPWAMAVNNVLGDQNCFDLAVFGANEAGTTGMFEAHEMVGPPEMYAEEAVSKDLGFLPSGEDAPVTLTFGDFSGEGYGLDFFAADLDEMYLVESSASLPLGLPTALPRRIGREGTDGLWTDINGLFTRPSLGPNGNDLVVIEQFGLTWMHNDGSGDFSVTAPTAAMTDEFVSRAIQEVDVDGSGQTTLDFIGGAGTDFGVYMIDVDGSDLTVTPRAWNPGLPVYNELNHLTAFDMGGNAQPDVVVLERDEQDVQPTKVMLIEDLFDGGSALQPETVSPPLEFPDDLDPWQMVATDFDGDGFFEVWAFDQDGDATCVQRATAGGGLVYCPP